MRVVLVARYLDTVGGGGSNYSLKAIATQLSEAGHDVTVVVIDRKAIDETVPFEVDYRDADGRLEISRATYNALTDYENEADLFHVFNTALLFVGGFYKKRGGDTPVVGRLNTYTEICSNMSLMDGQCHANCGVLKKVHHDERGLARRLARSPMYAARTYANPSLIRELDRLFAISPTVGRVFDEAIGTGDRTTVVPNFYDPDFQRAAKRTATDRSDATFDVLFTGRVEATKGVDVLLDAAERLTDPDLRVHIVGEGAAADDLRARTDDERVTFHGWVPYEELPEFYKSADVFVHPGRWPEPFGRTVLEAMQCSCPPLVSDAGAPPWVVGDAGVVFPREDAAALAETIADVRESDELKRLRAACPDRIARFAPEEIVERIETEYTDLVAGA